MNPVFVGLNLFKTGTMWTIENDLRNIVDIDVVVELGVPLNHTVTAAEPGLEIAQIQVVSGTPPFSQTPIGYRSSVAPLQ